MQQNIIISCTQSLADTYFARTLRNGYQHNIHDADAAHQEGDGRNAAQQHGNAIGRFHHRFHDSCHIAHGEVVVISRFNLVAIAQHLLRLGLYIVNNILIFSLQRHSLHIGDAHHAILSSGQRNVNHIVLVLTHAALAFALEHANYLKGSLINAHHFSHWLTLGEKTFGYSGADNSHSATAI